MKSRSAVFAGALAALLAGPVLADGFSYNFLEAEFIDTEIEDVAPGVNIDGEGFALSGAVEFGPTLHGFGSVRTVDFEQGVDADWLTLGMGFNTALAPALDLVAGVSYERLKVSLAGEGSEKEEGIGLNAGLRGRAGNNLELFAGLKYVNYGHGLDDTTINVGGRYYVTPKFALGLSYSENDDGDSWFVALRYDFGDRY